MAKLKNVLRCYAMGMGIKEISSAFNLSRNTVRKYVRAFQESGLSLEKVLGMSDEHLYGMLVGGKSRTRDLPDGVRNWTRSFRNTPHVCGKGASRSASSSRNTAVNTRTVTVTRISASCCGGTCSRPRPSDMWSITRASRCMSTSQATGLR